MKMEIARAWYFSEEDLPAELEARVDARRPTRPFDSVFEAVQARLALAIGLYEGHGVVPSASHTFSQTRWRSTLAALLEACVPSIRRTNRILTAVQITDHAVDPGPAVKAS